MMFTSKHINDFYKRTYVCILSYHLCHGAHLHQKGRKMEKILTVYNNKGGVGKTHLCVNLAAIYSIVFHYKTLLIDLDPQANASHFLLRDENSYSTTISDILNSDEDINTAIYQSDEISNLYIIPADSDLDDVENQMLIKLLTQNDASQELALANRIQSIINDFDMIIIDTHPSQKRLLNINALCASSTLLCPVESSPDSFHGLNGISETFRSVLDKNPKLQFAGVVYTKFRNTNADFKALSVLSETLAEDGLLFTTCIPLRTKAVETWWMKKPLILYAPNDDCTQAYIELATEINQKMEGR